MNETLKQLRELDQLVLSAIDAYEHDQPGSAYALLSAFNDRHYATLNALKMQAVARYNPHAAE